MVHFNIAMFEVRNFNKSVVISTLKQRLRSNYLIFSLNKKFSNTYDEMLAWVQKYTQAKEKEIINKQVKKEKNGKKQSCEKDYGAQ